MIHLHARAEKRLGYVQTVSPRQKAAYKPVAQRRAEDGERAQRLLERWAAELEPEELKRVMAIVEEHGSIESEEELKRLLRPRLEHLRAGTPSSLRSEG